MFISIPSDEDDTAELLRELQKIRKERKEDEERKVAVILSLSKRCIKVDPTSSERGLRTK